jgi:hypothetical protein
MWAAHDQRNVGFWSGFVDHAFLKVGGIYRLASIDGHARYITGHILHDHCSRLMIYESYIGASDAKWGA